MQSLGSIVFTIVMFVGVVPSSLMIIGARIFGRRASYAVGKTWARATAELCRLLCGLDYTVEGEQNLPERPSVIYLKHSSAFEVIVQWLLFPRQAWVMKRELMWIPFLGWALATFDGLAINRSGGQSAVRQIVKQGKRRLADGFWVIIFPEGTRMPPGETRRYGISGVLLAQEAECMIVPVAHNAGDFWPRRGWKKRPGTVQFCMGPPVNPSGRDPRSVNEELQRWIENKVTEIRTGSAVIKDRRRIDNLNV